MKKPRSLPVVRRPAYCIVTASSRVPKTEIQVYGYTAVVYSNYSYELETGGQRVMTPKSARDRKQT